MSISLHWPVHSFYVTTFVNLLIFLCVNCISNTDSINITKMRPFDQICKPKLFNIIREIQVNNNHLFHRPTFPIPPIAFIGINHVIASKRLFNINEEDKTFVSGHYRVLSSEIVDYLFRKKIEFVEHPLKFTLKYCPFCPPHKFQSDNLFKHEIFKNSGNSYCHRCNYRGSLFDLKKAFGDLDSSLFSSFKGYNMSPLMNINQNEPAVTLKMDNLKEYTDNLFSPKYADVLNYLKNRGLTEETLKKYYVGAGEFAFSSIPNATNSKILSQNSGQVIHKCIVFPWITNTKSGLTLERMKIRSITSKSKMKILPPNGSWGLFGDHLRADGVNEIVLTEGEIDAMSVNQSTGKIAISFPNGANSLPIPILPRLENISKLYIWLDFDAAGQNSVDHFATKLGLGRSLIVREIETALKDETSGEDGNKTFIKDANEALMNGVDLNLYLKSARQISHSQIMSFKDIRQLVYDELTNPASTCGLPSITLPGVTELIRGHRRGELSIWTGPTGAGKTTLLSQLSLDYCVQGVSTLWGSFEINNVRLAKMMLRQFCGRNLERDLTHFDFYADKFQQLPLKFMKFHGSTSLDQVIDAMDYAAYVFDVGHIIIDNLQFMLSGQQGKALDLWDLQNKAIEKFRRFTTQKNVHISLVVHPRKEPDGVPLGLSSVFGSVKSTQEADNVFIVQNVIGQNRSIDIKKNRFSGRLGRVLFKFDPISLVAEQVSIENNVNNANPDPGLESNTNQLNNSSKLFNVICPSAANETEAPPETPSMDPFKPIIAPKASLFNPIDIATTNKHIQPVQAVSQSKTDTALTIPAPEVTTPPEDESEDDGKTSITLRSVTINDESSIAELRNFIKVNNLSEVIKTAGKGIKKKDIFQKIVSYVPSSVIQSNFGNSRRNYSTAAVTDYPFNVSGTVPFLDRFLASDKFPDLFPKGSWADDVYVYVPKNTLPDINNTVFVYVESAEKIPEIIKIISKFDVLGIDTETTGLNPREDHIRLIQVSTPLGLTFVFDLLKIGDEQFMKTGIVENLLNSKSVKIFHNAKFDVSFLKFLGVDKKSQNIKFNSVSSPIFDTLIASKLVEASRMIYGFKLDQVCHKYLGISLDKTQQYSDWSLPVLSEEQVIYSARDAAVLLPLYDKLKTKIAEIGLDTIANIEFRCILAVVDMELNGIQVDKNKLNELWKQLHFQRDLAEKKLKLKLGEDLNCNSQPQLVKALQNLGVKDIYTKRLIMDTNETTLSRNSFHPAVFALREYRKWNKAVNAFVDKLPKHINPLTNRIHPNFNQCGTGSGRFSCDNPNLQQIPRDAKFRSCFVPRTGFKFAIADLSQIELRIAADISMDETMINAYLLGQDLHSLTASIITKKKIEDVTKEERQVAKAVNFGLLFGMTPVTFRQYAESMYNVKLTLQQAKTFHQSFFNCYKGITKWHENIKNEKPLEVRTLTNRISLFDNFSFTKTLNYPVQGTSADIIKEALGNIVLNIKDVDGRLVMCVHDEVIIEVPENKADEGLDILIKTMEQAGNKFLRHVPCVAQGSIGTSWADK